MKARAFAPGHITGFFQICDQAEDPLKRGSRGAGVTISRGVTTSVEVEPAQTPQIYIKINGSPDPAPVSKEVISSLLTYLPDQDFKILVNHEVAMPIGYGFGTSGAGALSLSLALNHALKLGLTRIEAAQIAHIVEVRQRTGLGTVIAETLGGIEMRITAGGPGVGVIKTIPSDNDCKVVCLPFGPIPTPEYLNDERARQRINELGGSLIDALQLHPTVKRLLQYSRRFAEHIQILTKRVNAVLHECDEAGFICSSAIFGENVFSLVTSDEVQELKRIFDRHKTTKHEVLVMDVDYQGAQLLDG
ncbi:MAG: pantoate kinase [Candidatus Hodarchaeota archaeon]